MYFKRNVKPAIIAESIVSVEMIKPSPKVKNVVSQLIPDDL